MERLFCCQATIVTCRLVPLIALAVYLSSFIIQEINDFTDVTPGQKRFMKVWNHFLTHKSDGVTLAPRQLPSICLEFAQNFARRSICDDDEEQFTRSLFNLMDENYLGCLQVEQILKVYREARKSSSRDSVAMPVSPTPSPKQSSPKPMLATMAEYHDSYGADESESHEDDDTF